MKHWRIKEKIFKKEKKMSQVKTPVTIMRAGTSKGIFIIKENLPKNKQERDRLILSIFGSPDIRQIDGLGGADPLTSKLAIVGPSTREDADVDYTFGQVSFKEAIVDYSGNCGNISAGVGPFAIDEKLVKVTEPFTTIRVHNTNTGKILVKKVPVENGIAKVEGEYKIAGVPNSGAEIMINFSDTAGAATGKLLPTGNVIDNISVDGYGDIEVSIVDAANPVVFVKAESLNLSGIETPTEIDSNEMLLGTLEEIRGKASVMMGMISEWKESEKKIPAFPMIAFVSESKNYTDFIKGAEITEDKMDFVSRLMFMQVTHKTYAGTATICTGTAARVEGTVVNQVMKAKNRGQNEKICIGHPAGIIDIKVAAKLIDRKWELNEATISRTARRIMDGNCYTPKGR